MRTLIQNAHVLTMNEDLDEFQNGWILIEGTRITGLGAGLFPDDISPIENSIDAAGKLVMPGMINTHCHMPMTLFRGLGEDVDDRLFRYILPLERELITAEVVRVGAQLATAEMLLGGVTTVTDMYYFERETGDVLASAGMRGIVGQTLGDFDAPDHRSFDEGFALVDELREHFSDSALITASIAPHAPYSTDLNIMERVAQYRSDHPDVLVQMHLAEMKSEMEWCEKTHNCRPIELVDRAGLLAQGSIFAHCIEVTDSEIELMAGRGVGIAHNPRSNAKAGRPIAPVEAMQRAGLPVALATDGAMSSNTLDVFSQLAPASMVAKLRGNSRACLSAVKTVQMATIDGARALGMQEQIGSLEVGKLADLIMVDLDAPRLAPIHDIYATIVFSMLPSDVDSSMIHGKWVVEQKALVSMDVQSILGEGRVWAKTFQNFLSG